MAAEMKYKILLFFISIFFYHINAFAQINNTDISYILEADQIGRASCRERG